MSIIFEALQKTQHNRQEESTTPLKQKFKSRGFWKRISLLAIAFILLVLIFYYSNNIKNSIHNSFISQAQMNKEILSKLALNGVFISNQNRLVEINHKFFQQGDTINGLKIVSIEFNKITLQKDKDILEVSFIR